MGFYRFKEKGPAFGLGNTEGEIVAYNEKEKIKARCLVPVVDREGKPLGRQVIADKEYTVEYLLEMGVIMHATEKDIASVKGKNDINSVADALATQTRLLETQQFEARKQLMK
jgi:hypothetical protein